MAVAHRTDTQMLVEHRRGEFVISTDPERLSLDVIHGFLTNCYWAKGIPREVCRSLDPSMRSVSAFMMEMARKSASPV